MEKVFAIALILLALCVVDPVSASTNAESYGIPASIAESKKRGSFVRTVTVTPNFFTWEGEKVVVSECWVEGTNLVVFRLLINGRRQEEHRIYRLHKGLLFREEDSKP